MTGFAIAARSARARLAHGGLDDPRSDWTRLEPKRPRADTTIYYLAAAGSFIETGADFYSANVVTHFADLAVRHWLAGTWEPEELSSRTGPDGAPFQKPPAALSDADARAWRLTSSHSGNKSRVRY